MAPSLSERVHVSTAGCQVWMPQKSPMMAQVLATSRDLSSTRFLASTARAGAVSAKDAAAARMMLVRVIVFLPLGTIDMVLALKFRKESR